MINAKIIAEQLHISLSTIYRWLREGIPQKRSTEEKRVFRRLISAKKKATKRVTKKTSKKKVSKKKVTKRVTKEPSKKKVAKKKVTKRVTKKPSKKKVTKKKVTKRVTKKPSKKKATKKKVTQRVSKKPAKVLPKKIDVPGYSAEKLAKKKEYLAWAKWRLDQYQKVQDLWKKVQLLKELREREKQAAAIRARGLLDLLKEHHLEILAQSPDLGDFIKVIRDLDPDSLPQYAKDFGIPLRELYSLYYAGPGSP